VPKEQDKKILQKIECKRYFVSEKREQKELKKKAKKYSVKQESL
jgi:hypothetical protein